MASTINNNYLALGDSYSTGEAIPEKENFPNQLATSLGLFRPHIVATTGWTTADLLQAISQENLSPNYDLVTLLIGVNNQYQAKTLDQYKTEFNLLTDIAITKAGKIPGHVILVSIPDYGVTPFASDKDPKKIADELDEYNAYAKSVALQKGLHFIDISGISRAEDPAKEMLAEDGLHPSGKQYSEWVKLILPVAKKLLNKAN